MAGKLARKVELVDGDLLSTRSGTGATLTLDRLRALFRGADTLRIASAYYDDDFLLELLEGHSPRTAEIQLLFNGLGGERLRIQVEELSALRAQLSKRGFGVQVRLAFEPGIFHSKLFLHVRRGRAEALIGSANATRAAMTINEEILFVPPLRSARAFASYFDAIWQRGEAIDRIDERRLIARSLVQIFRTGSLYFKPTQTLTVTLNPFSEFLGLLTPEEKKRMGGVQLRHADTSDVLGPFNLRSLMQGQSDVEADRTEAAAHAGIKPYSIETCFGYWVPKAYVDLVETRLEAVSKRRRQQVLQLRGQLLELGEKRLQRAYSEYLASAEAHLSSSKVNTKDVLRRSSGERGSRGIVDPFSSTSRFVAFLERLFRNLDPEGDYLDRLCRPFIGTGMPEIWEDRVAAGEFDESFFEFLEYMSGRPRKRLVAGVILRAAGVLAEETADVIRGSFERHLRARGWRLSDWPAR